MKHEMDETGKLPNLKKVRELHQDYTDEEVLEGIAEFIDNYYSRYGTSVL